MEHMAHWFFIILGADLVAAILIGSFNRVDWKKMFRKKRKKRIRKGAQITPLRKAE